MDVLPDSLLPTHRHGSLSRLLLPGALDKAPTRWRKAVQAAVHSAVDPWAGRKLHLLPMEHCVRLRFSNGKWITDDGASGGRVIGWRAGCELPWVPQLVWLGDPRNLVRDLLDVTINSALMLLLLQYS